MLQSSVLVLNRGYFPVSVTTVQRAFTMLYIGVARALDAEFRTFDFQSWSELSVAVHEENIGLVGRMVRVPRVVALNTFDRLPKRTVRFSRLNIMLRDQHTCQYCGHRFKRSQLNLDHVIPRARGGKTTWENIVTSCLQCNHRKGGRLPADAGLKLIRHPFRPRAIPFFRPTGNGTLYEQWKPFISLVDFSYWNVELEP